MTSGADTTSPSGEGPQFGIVQGRLLPAPPGMLQWFPQERWQEEFFLAGGCGLDYVELIAERELNPNNPVWSDIGVAEICSVAQNAGLIIHAICDDYVINHGLSGDAKVLHQCLALLRQAAKLGAKKYVLPLFEQSEIRDDNVASFQNELMEICSLALEVGVQVCVETALRSDGLRMLVERVGSTALSVVFDTGNRAAHGHDLPAEIRNLRGYITHVHLKDKNSNDLNVFLGTGLVDFKSVFEALDDIGYQGPYTFESQRGRDPVRTVRYNIQFAEFFIAEARGR